MSRMSHDEFAVSSQSEVSSNALGCPFSQKKGMLVDHAGRVGSASEGRALLPVPGSSPSAEAESEKEEAN